MGTSGGRQREPRGVQMLDDDVKISVVLREASPKLRDNLLEKSRTVRD